MDSLSASCKAVNDALIASLERAFATRQRLTEMSADDSVDLSPVDLHARLIEARKVVDVLEFELVKAIMLKSQAARLKSRADADVEEAEVSNASAETRVEYMSARDRNIDVNTRTIASRRLARIASDTSGQAYDVVRAIQELHRGADGYRRELDSRIRAVTLTTSLER